MNHVLELDSRTRFRNSVPCIHVFHLLGWLDLARHRPSTHRHRVLLSGRRRSRIVEYDVRADYVMDCTALCARLAVQIDPFYTSRHEEDDGLEGEDALAFIECRQSAGLVRKLH